MNRFITALLGGTEGARSSEARFGLVAVAAGLLLIYAGQPQVGAEVLMVATGLYTGSRTVKKATSIVAASRQKTAESDARTRAMAALAKAKAAILEAEATP